jgi:hypothetical protein
MKKEVKKVRVTKVRRELDQLRTDVSSFYQELKRRRTVTHSTTPAIVKGPDSKPSEATIKLVELVSVITTAETLGKQVMLTAGKNLEGIVCVSVNLVDKYPNTPASFWSI